MSAFPTYESMEQLVRLLDVNLAEISRRGNLRDVVFDVVRWADRENRVPELCREGGWRTTRESTPSAGAQARPRPAPRRRSMVRQARADRHLAARRGQPRAVAARDQGVSRQPDQHRAAAVDARRSCCFVVVAGWWLYTWLVGGAVRARSAHTLRRLVAHSRLERRDWLAFGATARPPGAPGDCRQRRRRVRSPCRSIASRQASSGRTPSSCSSDRFRTFRRRWSSRAPSAPGSGTPSASRRPTTGRTLFVGGRNLARRLRVQIDLSPSVVDTTGAAAHRRSTRRDLRGRRPGPRARRRRRRRAARRSRR